MRTIDIFEVKLAHQLKILKVVWTDNGKVNIDRISKQIGLDPRTVKLLWQDISEIIDDNYQLNKMEDYLSVRIKIYKQSWVYDFCEDLLLGNEVSIVSFMLKHYLSESSLRKNIVSINRLLEPLGIKIVSRKGFYTIKGSEIQIRYLAYQFFWSIYKGIEWPFLTIEKNKIADTLENVVFNKTTISIKETSYAEWSFVMAINLVRFNQGHKINKKELPKFIFNVIPKEPDEVVHPLFYNLTDLYSLTTNENIYFFLQLAMRPQFYSDDYMFNQNLALHRENNTDIYKVYLYFMDFLNKNILYEDGLRIAESMILSSCVTASALDGYSRTITGYDLEDYFNAAAPNLLIHIDGKIKEIQNNYPEIKFLKKRKYLTVKFAEAYSLVSNMTYFEKKIYIGVMTDMSSSVEEILVRKLNSHFGIIENVEFLTINQQSVTSFDLVLKTSVTISDNSNNDNYIIVNQMIEEKDYYTIIEEIHKIRQKIELL